MNRSEKDRLANQAATFLPYDEQDGETQALPCIEIGGVQVYAYVRDGILVISADYDTADTTEDTPFALYGPDDAVPTVVKVGGEQVFEAFPDDAVSEYDAKLIRKVNSGDPDAWPKFVIPDWAE